MLQPPPIATPMYATPEDMAIGALTPQWAIWFQEVQQYQLAYQDNAFFEVWSGSFYNNTPSAGHVAWDKVKVKYGGLRYSVAENGSTDKRYIYWEPAYPKKFFSSDDLPFISPYCIIVGENISGTFVTDNIGVLRRVHAGLTYDGTVAPGKVIQSSLADGIINMAKLADNIINETKLALDLRTIKVVATLPESGTQDQLVLLSTDGKLYQWQTDKWVPFIRDNDEVSKIANNIIDQTKLALDLRAIKVVATLPESGTSGQVVFLTTDSKLYRWNGTAWTVAVPTSDLSGTITETQIADDSISTPKLKAGSVKTDNLDALAVTAAKIAANTITAGEISAGAIGTDQLAANSVVASKIATGTITATQIAAGAIGTDQLNALSVTAAKIAANTITAGQISAGAIGTDQLAANSIVATKMALTDLSQAIPDPGFNDLAWWGLTGLASNILWVDDAGYAGRPKRLLGLHSPISLDRYSSFFEVVPSAHYRLRLHIYKSADTTGTLGLLIHRPAVQWTSPVAAMHDSGTAIDVSGLGDGWSTHELMVENTGPQRWQFRTFAELSAGYVLFAWEVTRAANASLIVDGSIYADKIYARQIVADKIALANVNLEHFATNAVSYSIGDISTYQFLLTATHSEGVPTYQDLDLSSIVPAGYRAVKLAIELYGPGSGLVDPWFRVRRKGWTNTPQSTYRTTSTRNAWVMFDNITVEMNTDRELEIIISPPAVPDPPAAQARVYVLYAHL